MTQQGGSAGVFGTTGVPATARALMTVDLGAIQANWRWLSAVARPAVCAGVVKADAYGLGLEPVASALAAAGCHTFFVATLREGERLRARLPDATCYVLDGLIPGTAPAFAAARLRPVLGSRAEIEEWAALARSVGARLPAAIHIDTGMGRLGMTPAEVTELAGDPAVLGDLELALIISHLACADDLDSDMSERQRRKFETLRALLPAAPASLANSAGILRGPAFHYDIVRAGIALYGGRAVEGRPNPAAKVVRLEARILQVRDLTVGDTVGYGATFVAVRPTRIATIATGYADGFLRSISGPIGSPAPPAYIDGHPAPMVGRISMDVSAIDVTDLPPGLAQRGAWVELIGRDVMIDDLADSSGTIGYEILSRLGPRVERRYIAGS